MKTLIKNLNLLEDLKVLQEFHTLNINFVMIYIIHKISDLLKISRITRLKVVFSNAFLREYNRLSLKVVIIIILFFIMNNDGLFNA